MEIVEGKPAIIGKPDANTSIVPHRRKAAIIANLLKGMTTSTQLELIDRMLNQSVKIQL